MAKRRKRPITKKKKDEEDDNVDEELEEPTAKKVAVSSTSLLEEEINTGTSGCQIGFSSHFWCNYCEFSSDTKKELITHMREHMVKCLYCTFSSLSKADIAKHVKTEHADESEKSVCEVDSSSSSTEHDMDKDPCSACIFCDFMTYSTEHLEKHTKSKHQGMLPKSVAKMISKQISARVRRDDALFYFAISSEAFDTPFNPVESSDKNETGRSKSPIFIEPEKSREMKTEKDCTTYSESLSELKKSDLKPNHSTLSDSLEQKSASSENVQEAPKMVDWKVKVETLYCLSCPYSNVAIDKLKCHALAKHPHGVAACSFNSEGACRMQDVNFFCIRENCSYTNIQSMEYEEHMMACCSKDSLSDSERERLNATISLIFKFNEKEGLKSSQSFLKFSSLYCNNTQAGRSSTSPPNLPSPSTQLHTANQESASASRDLQQGGQVSDLIPSTSCTQSSILTKNEPSVASTPVQASGKNTANESQTSSFQDPFISSVNTLNQNQSAHDQQVNVYSNSYSNNNSGVLQNPEMSTNISHTAFDSNKDMQPSTATGSSYPGQPHSVWNEHTSQQGIPNTNTNFPPESNSLSQSSNNQQPPIPASFNFATNMVHSGQQNVFSQSESNQQMSQPLSAPAQSANNAFFPSLPGNTLQNNPPFSSNSQQQQSYPQDMSFNAPVAPFGPPSINTPVPFPENSQPKMMDLLNETPSILLDDDLDIQPWPSTLAQSTSSTHSNSQSFAPATQPTAGTNPLPQSHPFPSLPNQPDFSTNYDTFTNQQIPANPVQHSDFHPPYQNQSQIPVHNSGPQGVQTPDVIDITNQPTNVTLSSLSAPNQIEAYANPVAESAPIIHNNNSNDIARNSHILSNTAQNSSQNPASSAGVPNFLVPPSNMSNTQDPNSFLNPPAPHQSSTTNPQLPPQQPITPLKNPAMGQPRTPNSNSPLSPSIYLNGRPPLHPQAATTPQGFSPSPQRMRGPHPMNPGVIHPHIRQQLFVQGRGRPRGSRSRMMRPPVHPVDDDVIVTAVVRGPPPQGQRLPPPVGQRGGRGRPPTPRGRGGPGRGRGRPPMRGAPTPIRGPIDVSRHFVDLACVVNPNEEMGNEADEIQIVGVTPGKGGKTQPKAVDAKKFSYCCIHCGEDQGSKQVMKRHIKATHSESLLGAFRNVETGQWLFFCPQLSCEFMTYDENRLTDHLFSCYNLDRNKQLPFDMQSALRNLKSLKIRQVNVHANAQPHTVENDGQGLRDAFNNNLKDAFDDMVENTITRQAPRPNQPPNPPYPPPPHVQSHRGAMRGPYPPRPPMQRSPRQRYPRPGEMPPSYRPRNPMMGGSPRPRQPQQGARGRPRNPGQFPGQRAMAPLRNQLAARGQRPPNRGFMPRPCLPGMPGNEQTPIVIDLDADSPEKPPETTDDRGQTGVHVPSMPTNTISAEAMAMAGQGHMQGPPEMVTSANMTTPLDQRNQFQANDFNQSNTSYQAQIPRRPSHENPNSSAPVPPNGIPIITTLNQNSSHSGKERGANHSPSTFLSHGNQPTYGTSYSDSTSLPMATPITTNNELPPTSNLTASTESPSNISSLSSLTTQDDQSTSLPPEQASSAKPTAVRDIPSPSDLMAEVTAYSKRPRDTPLDSTSSTNVPQDPVPPESHDDPSKHVTNPPSQAVASNIDEEEQVNTILLEKVFAKVPHMPKKLSQRLVLKFKKYAADRGVIITPTSKVIDEFVSKISYKGSHSAPSGGQQSQETRPASDLPPPPQTPTNSAVLPGKENGNEHVQHALPTVLPSMAGDSSANSTSTNQPGSPLPNQSTEPAQLSEPPGQGQISQDPKAVDNNSNKDIIETKVILSQRNLQFSGTFANIVKTKTEPERSPSPVTEGSEKLSENVDSEGINSLSSHSVLLPQTDSPESFDNGEDKGKEILEKSVKREMPFTFPSSSKEDSIEVQSSVDHLICGHASLEVDIAGKPISASDLTNKPDSPVNVKRVVNKDKEVISSIDSSGKLLLKVKKSSKPRIPFAQSKEDEIVPEENEKEDAEEDHFIRRSERKRKVVKTDYEPEEMDEMDELVSDDDDDYHVSSDESYDGSDRESGGRKKAKKCKSPTDPTAFDLTLKGHYGCWSCSKSFSRAMFVKRHIVKKHKVGFCAIILSDDDMPSSQPNLLLFCPQNCRYVTSNHDAFYSHLENCDMSPLNTGDMDYRITQKDFLSTELQKLVDDIASGAISTKVLQKTSAPRRKNGNKLTKHPESDMMGGGSQFEDANSVVTTVDVHHPPASSSQLSTVSNPHFFQHEMMGKGDNPPIEVEPCSLEGVIPHGGAEGEMVDHGFWNPNLSTSYSHEHEFPEEENFNEFDQVFPSFE